MRNLILIGTARNENLFRSACVCVFEYKTHFT